AVAGPIAANRVLAKAASLPGTATIDVGILPSQGKVPGAFTFDVGLMPSPGTKMPGAFQFYAGLGTSRAPTNALTQPILLGTNIPAITRDAALPLSQEQAFGRIELYRGSRTTLALTENDTVGLLQVIDSDGNPVGTFLGNNRWSGGWVSAMDKASGGKNAFGGRQSMSSMFNSLLREGDGL